ncbi:uncharacterized protein LOC110737937 [Chenopodium quinoa]|uniref:uncharacterized protein LOC110737937 n=1 Tax=Chenopodium quinoa TaxID=63459 RepID=UPI000B7917F7|nr:uncharacterized protein LOC110737937 [Chenopodium quinoa]
MSNLAKLEFVALDITGNNYMSWVLDAEIHLDAKGLGDTIKENNTATSQDKAKVMIFLRHHLHEGLKTEYLTVKDPQVLWSNLKERYDHQKTVILPKARYDWLHLRLQDFKSVSEYNSAMFRITSQLKLCGEKITDAEMLEKTYSTFHANNVVLQTHYREKEFTKYSDLISCLLVAEQNNEILMKNHESRPIGSTPFPEANATSHSGKGQKARDHASSRGRGGHFRNSYSHQNWDNKDGNKNEKDKYENICYRYGGKGHWSRVCRTPKHLVDLYQQSINQTERKESGNKFGVRGWRM